MAAATSWVKRGITLTLSEPEARTLEAILQCVAGDTERSPAFHSDAILKALRGPLGLSDRPYAVRIPERALIDGTLFFRDYGTED